MVSCLLIILTLMLTHVNYLFILLILFPTIGLGKQRLTQTMQRGPISNQSFASTIQHP